MALSEADLALLEARARAAAEQGDMSIRMFHDVQALLAEVRRLAKPRDKKPGKALIKAVDDFIAGDTFLVFPCAGEPATWVCLETQAEKWMALFPGIDVRAQVRAALAWVQAGGRTKTARGMPKFLVAWLTRANDRPRQTSTDARGMTIDSWAPRAQPRAETQAQAAARMAVEARAEEQRKHHQRYLAQQAEEEDDDERRGVRTDWGDQ